MIMIHNFKKKATAAKKEPQRQYWGLGNLVKNDYGRGQECSVEGGVVVGNG